MLALGDSKATYDNSKRCNAYNLPFTYATCVSLLNVSEQILPSVVQ